MLANKELKNCEKPSPVFRPNLHNSQVNALHKIHSWHHRIAKILQDIYSIKCEARKCPRAALFACEYDFIRSHKPVSGTKLYCNKHAFRFAQRHGIDIFKAPIMKFSQLENANRDDWAFAEERGSS